MLHLLVLHPYAAWEDLLAVPLLVGVVADLLHSMYSTVHHPGPLRPSGTPDPGTSLPSDGLAIPCEFGSCPLVGARPQPFTKLPFRR